MLENTAPSIEEQYISAGSSSNLRCETREDAPAGAVGVMIAAGWSRSRLGTALMRLRTEFDGAAKPGKMTQSEAILLLGQMKSLTGVLQQVSLFCSGWRMERPERIAAALVCWWLDHGCEPCGAKGKQAIPGTPALSNINCKHCHGTGETKRPYGRDGERVVAFLDDCRDAAVASIRSRLRNRR